MVKLKGTAVSPGIAVGTICVYNPSACAVTEAHFPEAETAQRLAEYETAVSEAKTEIEALIGSMEEEGDDKAEILEAHLEILEDEEMTEEIQTAIAEERLMPDAAVKKVFDKYMELLGGIEDALFQERIADMKDVSGRIVQILHGEKNQDLSQLPGPCIIAAHDLLPSDTAAMDKKKVLGIVAEAGGATSHSAILARSYQIPAILGVPGVLEQAEDGKECILDALEGQVYLNPDEEAKAEFTEKQKRYLADVAEAANYLKQEGALADGTRIDIGLNIGSDEASEAYAYCDFVGLFRSEFLYMQGDHLPSEEEQYQAYTRVLSHADGRPVTLRTLDIGGDKTLSYYTLPQEENPFLGKRALRLCLSEPELFHTQLRSALRASAKGKLQLMFPMVGTLDDIRNARAALEEAKEALRGEGIPFDEEMKVGIMIEIPAIAEIADLVAQEVDFASIGTNDLTQYLHAADRMNGEITSYYQSLSPAVFRVLRRIITAFTEAGKPVSVCGELGGDPKAAVILAGMGLRKTSMSDSSIAKVKRALCCFTAEEAAQTARDVCAMGTQEEIVQYMDKTFREKNLM